jgi:hypothetical protein
VYSSTQFGITKTSARPHLVDASARVAILTAFL